MSELGREVKRIEEGEAWEETDEVVELEVKQPLDKVIPVRLPAGKWEELRREARELGVGPTTLARMWLLEKLRQADWRRSNPLLAALGDALRLNPLIASQLPVVSPKDQGLP